MSLLLLRPYYGINVHGDMHGDLGISDHLPHIYPDVPFVNAATLANRRYQGRLEIIDANLERALPRTVLERLPHDCDEIVIKTAAPTIRCDLEFARELKRRMPSVRLHLAGSAAGLLHRWIREHCPEVDAVAQEPVDGYVRNLISGASGPLSINELPSPDYTLFPYRRMLDMDGLLRGALFMSRGCAVGCSYCPYPDFFGSAFDHRDVEKVLGDIEHLLSLGFDRILFRDQYFAASKAHARAMCAEIIRRKLEFRWRCETRLETLTPDLVDLMVEAGLEFISFGVESASVENLEAAHRPPLDEARLTALVRRLHQRKVRTLAFFMIGFPQDEWETMKSTYELAERLDTTTVKFSIYAPCSPGTVPEELRTPSLFVPFSNETTLHACAKLDQETLRYLQRQMTWLYHTNQARRASAADNYLASLYQYHVVHEQQFRKTVEELAARLQGASILDL